MTSNLKVGLGFGIGFALGAGASYLILRKQMEMKYSKLADAEIADMKSYINKRESDLVNLQRQIAEQPKPHLDKAMEELGYKGEDKEPEPETRNAFERPPLPPWDYNREYSQRDLLIPYVIHIEEFQSEDSMDHQITFTYFEGDDILVDEKQEVVTNRDEVVGEDNLMKFGHGSNDPHLVYIRNGKLGIDFEIILDKGHYAKEILGLEEESLEHSAMRRRRLRFDDDG